MKKFFSLLLTLIIVVQTSTLTTFAKPTAAKSNIIAELKRKPQTKVLTQQELFITMVDVIAEYGEIPASYLNIKIENPAVPSGTRLYKAYQKAVYLDILKPSQIPLPLNGPATHQKMVELTNLFYGEKINGETVVDGSVLTAIRKKLTYDDLVFYASNYLASKGKNAPLQNAPGYDILADVYQRILTEHVDKDKMDPRNLIYGAISGMAEATGDKYTTYFPPVASQEFSNEINGEFEGIGAYVDMSKPGELIITGPIPGSPAEAAGLVSGDQILKVDDLAITKETSISDAVRKIKGPSGTTVTLTILRGGEMLTKIIERKKIKIDLVTYKKLDSQTSYIQITSFGDGTTAGFIKAVNSMTADQTNRLILDLRNDGGGDLQEVSNVLDYFVPAGKAKIVTRSLTTNEAMFSTGQDSILTGKKIIILINKGTASASEILAGTIQDYLPTTTKTVGENSYGKGSVQLLYPYWDGSTFKYTIAKWFTGKTEKTIDHVGIKPDYEIILDTEKYKTGSDNQLDFAKSLNF